MIHVSEASYPITFRASFAKQLGDHLRHHHSVVLIGMKRVGISNFLRYFMHQPKVADTYIKNGPILWVHVDLNNLVELSNQAFWTVVLKRLVDSLETSSAPVNVQRLAERLFAESIQLNDPFFTLDSVQNLIHHTASCGVSVVIVLMRFDRLRDTLNPELFANLQAVKDSGGAGMAFIFTSDRPLADLAPAVFTKSATAVFVRDMYLKPAAQSDIQRMLKTFGERYELKLPEWMQPALIDLTGGHAQYLHLSLLKLKDQSHEIQSSQELQDLLLHDDELRLLSEEILSSLTVSERQALAQLSQGKKVAEIPAYLIETGVVSAKGAFSNPLFEQVAQWYESSSEAAAHLKDLTKKELVLFELLKSKLGEVIERDDIIEVVWPDQVELGVSDWALDRLVARLRAKLGTPRYPFHIVTVISRGYKLIDA